MLTQTARKFYTGPEFDNLELVGVTERATGKHFCMDHAPDSATPADFAPLWFGDDANWTKCAHPECVAEDMYILVTCGEDPPATSS